MEAPTQFDRFQIPQVESNEDGWIWIARVTRSTIAWVVLCSRNNKDRISKPPRLLEGLEQISKTRAVDVTWRIAQRVSGKNWYLLGDAAFVLDPSASDGVLRAMMSATKAVHCLQQKYNDYEVWLSRLFEAELSSLRDSGRTN